METSQMFIERWMDKMEHVCVYDWATKHSTDIYSGILLSHKKSEIMPFAATWMDLEIITLSELKTKSNTTWYYLYVEAEILHKWT